MLKPSKFNYIMYNDNNELLMFNTYTGRKLKALPKQSRHIEGLLKSSEIASNDDVIMCLAESGMLVNSDTNEDIKVEAAFNDLQSRPVLTLYILPTEQCNFRCIYCPETFERGKMGEDVQEGIINFIRKNINSYTGVYVYWFGGEPLLEMGVISQLSVKIKEICRNAKRSYAAHMTTNGYLLSYDNFCGLLKHNIFAYQITLDGFKESHDAQRPLINKEPTYDTIVNNLTEVKQKSQSGKFLVNLRVNFTKNMISDIPGFIDWFIDTFDYDPRFQLCIEKAANFDETKEKEVGDILISGSEDKNVFYGAINNSRIEKVKFSQYQYLSKGGCVCDSGLRNTFLFDADGNIRKCSCKLCDDEINKLGKLSKSGAMDIEPNKHICWNVSQKADKCRECFLLPICMGHSCPYHYMANKIPKCPETDITYILKIMDKQGYFERIDLKVLEGNT